MNAPDSLEDRISSLLNEVEARLDEGFPEEALQIALQARLLLKRQEAGAFGDLRIDCHYLLASCHFELQDMAAALREYQTVRELDAKDPEIDYWQGRALFHAWQFEQARALLEGSTPAPKVRAAHLYYRALTHDFLGDRRLADDLFARAAEEDPGEYPLPLRMDTREIQGMLDEILRALPPDVQRALENVTIQLLPLPLPRVHASPDVDPLVLGLYRGNSLLGRDPFAGPEDLERIEIFQRNVERICSHPDEAREEMRVTLLHEIGHHLGWDEGELAERGLN